MNFEFTGSFFGLDQLPRDKKVQIAVAGRSNVGKSSLLNKLAGSKKIAKVSSTPGKTRSLNFFLINEQFYIVDLPGYGYAKVSKKERNSWGRLIEDFLTESTDLIGLILLLDCRRDTTQEDMDLIDWLSERGLPVLIVVTKTDKLNRDKVNRKLKQIEKELGTGAVAFSTVTSAGKKTLTDSVFDLVQECNENKRT